MMRRVLQLLGLLVTVFVSPSTFAEEPAEVDTQEPTEEPGAEGPAELKGEQPPPVAPARTS